MSGIEAVKKIVETEAQAKRIVEDATRRASEILSHASAEKEKIRQEILGQVKVKREEILQSARLTAEEEARRSDIETSDRLESYRKALKARKDIAVEKAVELILRG